MAKSSRIWNARSIISLVLLLVLVLSLGNANIKKATAQNSVVYDYYFLIDTSGSMMNPPPEGGPAKIEQVKTIAQNFVDEIPEGATFILYTFTTQSNPVGVGTWKNIQSSDKEAIKQTISKISISIPQNTALWDSVCQALDTLDQLAKSLPPQTHVQWLMSYTDGVDTASKNTSTDCFNKYKAMKTSGYVKWILTAVGQPKDPICDIPNGPDCTGGLTPPNIVQIQPLVLDVGNLYPAGRSDPQKSCLVMWTSLPGLTGQTLEFPDPPVVPAGGHALPVGMPLQVCSAGSGGSCSHSIPVTNNATCLDISLVNFDPARLSENDYGNYVVNLGFKATKGSTVTDIYLLPDSLAIKFQLIPPTPTTALPTTPVPTTLVPTTPVPTPTPVPLGIKIDCGGKPEINFGTMPFPQSDPGVSDKKACTVTWPQDSQGIGLTAKLTWNTADNDQQILASQVFLAKGSTDDKQLSLAPGDTQLPVSIELPASLDNAINHDVCFNGTLGLQAGKAQINGDVTKTDSGQSIAVTFCLQKPPSPLPFIIGGLLLLVILVVLLWPRWPKDLKLLVDGQVYVGDVLELDHYGPFGAIRLGQGDVSVVLLSPQKKPGTYAEMLPSVKTSWLGQRLGGTDTATYHLVPKEGYELKETGATKSSKDPIDITAGQHIALVGKERTWQLMLRQDMPKKQGN